MNIFYIYLWKVVYIKRLSYLYDKHFKNNKLKHQNHCWNVSLGKELGFMIIILCFSFYSNFSYLAWEHKFPLPQLSVLHLHIRGQSNENKFITKKSNTILITSKRISETVYTFMSMTIDPILEKKETSSLVTCIWPIQNNVHE